MLSLRRLVAFALLAFALACSPGPRNDPSSNADGGSTADGGSGKANDCATTKSTRHTSYVPDGFTPKDVSRLIVMGDSISTGTGASAASLSYYALLDHDDTTTWPAEAATDLATFYGHDVPVVDVAVNGATTSDLAQEVGNLEQAVNAPKDHSIVVITIGGNDLQHAIVAYETSQQDPAGPPLDTALANLRAAVTTLQDPSKFPGGVSIYLMDVYDPTDGDGHAQGCFYGLNLPVFVTALDTWRTKYIELGTQMGFSVIDALGHFHGHGMNYAETSNQYYQAQDATQWFAPDCIHPNDRGHDELRRLFYEALDCRYVATP